MDPRELIMLLKASSDQGDQLVQRLIEELAERGAIIDELESLQAQQVKRQSSTAAIVTEAAMIISDINGQQRRAVMLGRSCSSRH